jgi:DNA invertase Pin-like site-specific DNA recombinase
MIYGYARVSTKGQAKDGNSLDAQERTLRENGAQEIYKDSFTGTKSHRPELDKLLEVIGDGDTLIITKLDRMARSATQGIELINKLLDRGVKVHILNMGIMDNTPSGKLIRTVMLAFAEFERDMIVERTTEGKAIAKLNEDFREGRPKVYKKAQVNQALELLDSGKTYKEVCEIMGMSKSTLIRAKRQRDAESLQK